MAPLSTIPLPLPVNQPPPGYGWEERDMSVLSTTTAFDTGIEQRDTFLGQPRCIICGLAHSILLQHCHIIRDSELHIWSNLKARHWIPSQAKAHPRHEPRDGLLMCIHHHIMFDAYNFFIRFVPDTRKFVFVNYSNEPILQQFHGKAIALDIKDHYAPFPSLFILHEMRVRGFRPFEPIEPDMPDDGPWQDWITSDGVFDNVSDSFKRDSPPDNGDNNNDNSFSTQLQPQHQPTTTSTGDASSGKRRVTLNADVIAEILAATRVMPSWKACQMEGTSWTGTAQENIEKYVSSIGIDSPQR
ncbi:hypothetical protein AN958_02060 [Leucoagaricus sp. SymC.cos]|nr:hypothetical protein AN958_02060 [Leucoagaricus sp. SymC.cos]